jgi:hypothetical protein
LSGFDRNLAHALFASGDVALVARLEDGRELRYLAGPDASFVGGHFVAWDDNAARAFSNWYWPLNAGASEPVTAITAVPVPLLQTRLAELDPLARLQSLSYALAPKLYRTIVAGQDTALTATGVDRAALTKAGRAAIIDGCWTADASVRFTAIDLIGGRHPPERKQIPGARPCQ